MYKRCITEQSARRQRELEQGLLEVMATRRYEDIYHHGTVQLAGYSAESILSLLQQQGGGALRTDRPHADGFFGRFSCP